MYPQESTPEGQPNAPPEAPGPRMSIQWQSQNALTDVLVNYLTTHPSDYRILFYSNGKKKMSPIDDGPSGRDKGNIHGIIAHLIFADHIKYGPAYHHNQKKFCDSVTNCISGLRTRYKKNKSQFTATGAGIVPLDGASAQNLLEKDGADRETGGRTNSRDVYEWCWEWLNWVYDKKVCVDLPWYSDLDVIWHSNPSMAEKMHSSKPGIDHAGALYSLVQPHGGAGLSTHFVITPPYPPNTQPSPNAYPLPSTHLPPSAYLPLNAHLPPTTYPPTAYPPNAYCPYTGNPLIDPQLLQPPTPSGTSPVHLPSINNSPDITIHDDFGPANDNDLHPESAGVIYLIRPLQY
ncbi:uncharacterized protein EDB91DRAFT_1256230 [Suillus paluster]|uniref:uncharacterized protein n=1 Tax=Suillus paluster TaxID=48578 RepID=UPI001B8759DE|nr:uncharacterized protein EDB91DRAFT_1256230 [Suillus paluster]KAG1722075.1 hypothetical protein EDB91DRAFT_1256230 [Suillus paluster]